jgi:hypothetical protein
MGTAAGTPSKEWSIVDAGSLGAVPLVFLRSTSGRNLEDWRGLAGLSSDTGREQKWMLTDAQTIGGGAGLGKVFVESLTGNYLEDRHGNLGLARDAGSYQMWTLTPISPTSSSPARAVNAASAIVRSSNALIDLSTVPTAAARKPRRSLLFTASRSRTELAATIETRTVGRTAELTGEQAAYNMGNIGILFCHAGYAPIDESKDDCQLAATYLAKTFSDVVRSRQHEAKPHFARKCSP